MPCGPATPASVRVGVPSDGGPCMGICMCTARRRPPPLAIYTIHYTIIGSKQDNASTGNTGSTCALDAGTGGWCQTEFGFTLEKRNIIGMSRSDVQRKEHA